MIILKLSFFAFLQEIFGKERYVSIDGPIRFIELFHLFKSKNGEDGASFFLDNASLKDGFTILIDGRNIQALAKLNTILKEECEISFFPAIAGGFH
ncbi:MAG: MoaD/ThiS family protein [Candidatus Hodarchaeota archaeon]